ncbi:probable glucan endo-1 3-beta-glucosidase a6, partial [Phtheirospermum japonicum]
VLFFVYFLFTDALIPNSLGINYCRVANNLPPPYQTIQLLTSMSVKHVKLYDANPEILTLLSATNLRVSIMVTNEQIPTIATNQSHADLWVQQNVLAHYPSTKIRSVLVGNEVFTLDDMQLWVHLVPAMRNIKQSLRANNIHNIKVGTPLAMDALESSFPPSSGKFRSDIPVQVIMSLMRFLNGTRSFFFLDVYPYLAWSADPTRVGLDFALLEGGNATYVDPASGLVYNNLLDQMVDSVVFAMRRLGFEDVRVAIAETGWPHAGDIDQPGANAYNAATYVRNLVTKMTAYPPIGTPARPGVEIPTFVFSLFDENQKPGPGTERNWGLLDNMGRPIYEVDFTGTSPVNNGTTELSRPVNNEPYKGRIWCVTANGSGLVELGRALDFTCGQGSGICDELAPGRGCYEPVSVVAHASYAFSSYWATYRSAGASCYFSGLAVQTTIDPSHESCHFPSVLI